MDQLLEALRTSAGMLWKALWALIFGYTISAAIQVLVTRQQMAKILGERGAKEASIAGFFGFVSSSCSFAALAATRAVFAKGAHATNAVAFLIASTNLVIELGLVLWVLVGWRFTLANFILGTVMIVYAFLLTRWVFPEQLAEQSREHAAEAEADEGRETGEGAQGSWRDELFSSESWQRIARAFFGEWRMVWKELLFGFTVAGFISVFVPQSFWNALFLISGEGGPDPDPGFLVVLENALVANLAFLGIAAALLWLWIRGRRSGEPAGASAAQSRG